MTHPIAPADSLATIDRALRDKDVKLHVFLSGGGLRVASIAEFYGEGPTLGEALRILGDDIAAGGRTYRDVYGKIEPEYLTGQSKPEGPLDAWVRQGRTIDVTRQGDAFVAELRGFEQNETSADIQERALKGETVRWTTPRGVTLETRPSRFPNGEACVMTSLIDKPADMNEHSVWMWHAVRRASAPDLRTALLAALDASPEEEIRR